MPITVRKSMAEMLEMRANFLFLALMPALLGGCSWFSGPPTPVPECPRVTLLPDANRIAQYRVGGADLTDLQAEGRIVDVNGACESGSGGNNKITVRVVIDAMRGPATTGNQVELPYFVAITDAGGNILDKQVYTGRADFESNATRTRMDTAPAILALPAGQRYTVVVGFQLTEAELRLNRTGSRR